MSSSSYLWILFVGVVVWLVQTVDSKVIRPSNNPTYNNNTWLSAINTTEPYTIYETVAVTIFVKDEATGHSWEAMYWPRVDEFSQLELDGTFNTSQTFNPNLVVTIQLANRTGEGFVPGWKHVYRTEDKLFVPYFTAVVLLDKGRVHGLTWQDGCHNCKDGDCLDNSCGTHRMDGSKDMCNDTDCNIKIYFAWTGRDRYDNACKSIDSTPQNFEQYSLTPTVNFGNGLWDDFIYNFKAKAPNPLNDAPNPITDSKK